MLIAVAGGKSQRTRSEGKPSSLKLLKLLGAATVFLLLFVNIGNNINMSGDQQEKKKYKLGEILIQLGALSEADLQKALDIQAKQAADEKYPIGRILLEEGSIEPNDLIEAIKIQSMQS